MEEAIIALLRNAAGIQELAGSRVNWGQHPQGAPLPGVVLHLAADREGITQSGRDRLRVSLVQVNCWANSPREASQLAEAVKDTLSGYRGGGFQGVFYEIGRGADDSSEANRVRFGRSLDFTTHWSDQNG